MPRKPYRRGTAAKFRGISKAQVCVLTALDSKKNIIIEPSCMGRPGSSDLLRVLGIVIKKESVLVTDSLFSYKTLSSYSKSKHISIPTGSHSIGSYNIQRINNLHSKVKSFMRPYKGVSPKYLSNYMFLFKYIESKCEATPLFFRGRKPYFSTNFKGRPPIIRIACIFYHCNFQQSHNELGINIGIAYIEWAIFYDRTDNIDYELA